MQRFFCIGNIGSDAVVKTVGETDVANFSVAVNESYKDKKGEKKVTTTWYECNLWKPGGVTPFLKKGTIVLVEGKPVANAYKKGEEIVSNIRITVDKVQLIASSANDTSIPTDLPGVDE